MRVKLNKAKWTLAMSTMADTLVSAEGDVRIYTVPTGGPPPVDVNDGHVYIHGEKTVFPSGLDIYAISVGAKAYIVLTPEGVDEPQAVYQTGTVESSTLANSRDVHRVGNTVAVASGSGFDTFVSLFDVTDPTDMVALPTVGGAGWDPHGLESDDEGNYLYVANKGTNNFNGVDISDPSNPAWNSTYGGLSGPTTLKVTGDTIFVADSGSAYALDITVRNLDPTLLSTASGVSTDDPKDSALLDDYFLVTSPTGGGAGADPVISVVDITDTSAISEVATFEPGGTGLHGIGVKGGYAFVVMGGSNEILALDILDPLNISQVGSLVLPSVEGAAYITISGDYAYVSASGSGRNVTVIDISDPFNMAVVDWIISPEMAGATGIDSGERFGYVVGAGQDLSSFTLR